MGYNLEINGQDIELTESDNGFLQATIDESGTYTLTYKKTPIMKIANIISIVTFVLCVMLLIKKKSKKLLALCEKV